PTHEPRTKRKEVPLRPGGGEHFVGVDADLVEDQRELIHQRDVQIALRVLDDLRGLGHLDRGGAVHAGLHDASVDGRHALERLWRVAGHDLGNARQRVVLIAWIYA